MFLDCTVHLLRNVGGAEGIPSASAGRTPGVGGYSRGAHGGKGLGHLGGPSRAERELKPDSRGVREIHVPWHG